MKRRTVPMFRVADLLWLDASGPWLRLILDATPIDRAVSLLVEPAHEIVSVEYA